MLSSFYRSHARHVLVGVLISLPILSYVAAGLPSNNDVETWLPAETSVRQDYVRFKQVFGAEETILIGLESQQVDGRLIESLCRRLERLPGIERCWSPDRLRALMREMGVPAEEANRRVARLPVVGEGSLIAVIAQLSASGVAHRAETVEQLRRALLASDLDGEGVYLAGAPVVVTELDRLGSQRSNRRFFVLTLGICLLLLYLVLKDGRTALAILVVTVWAIQLTTALVALSGGEMNFILGALSVMVMIFTLSTAVHFTHYFAASQHERDPLACAFRRAWKPCCLATLTTVIGLLSLCVSRIAPVRQFGFAASIGCVVALLAGLGVTPAVLAVVGFRPKESAFKRFAAREFGGRMLKARVAVAAVMLGVVGSLGIGLTRLESHIDPVAFLPKDSRLLADIQRVESDLTDMASIEAVVDFSGHDELTFVEKLDRVRRWEALIAAHPAIRHTMSLATFFPAQLPENTLQAADLLARAKSRQGDSGFVDPDQRLWRITARIDSRGEMTQWQTFCDLERRLAGAPITLTGMAPLLECTQRAIFDGFWKSIGLAFVVITIVTVLALRSLGTGLLAMIPNLAPIAIVFGMLGWIGYPVDIGMMMCGSIALGIAVDGTYHFLASHQRYARMFGDSVLASHAALKQTAAPIAKAALIASIGMLALTFSRFVPTARFGWLMAVLLTTAVAGDLILLPCLMAIKRVGWARSTEAVGAASGRHPTPPATRQVAGEGRPLPAGSAA